LHIDDAVKFADTQWSPGGCTRSFQSSALVKHRAEDIERNQFRRVEHGNTLQAKER